MNRLFVLLLAGAGSLASAPVATAQTASVDLPMGLLQRTALMAPLAGSEGGVMLKAERRRSYVRVLSASDRILMLRALQAIEASDWIAARGLAAQVRDPVGRRIIQWKCLLDKDSGANFAEIAQFLRENAEWPSRDLLYVRAEAAMGANQPPQTVLAFFSGREPATEIGKVRLGEACLATGDVARGRALIRDAWINGDFELVNELEIASRHADLLTPDVNQARLNRLLFEDQTNAAQRQLARVTAQAQQLAQIRIGLDRNPQQGAQFLRSVPPSLQNDPGLLFDWAKLLTKPNQVNAVPPILSRAPVRALAQINAGKWWSEVNLAARTAIQDRSYTTAHTLATGSGLTSGTEFADAEFLAGWLDLRFLRNAREARTHFLNVVRAVARPISKARGFYWAGRASEAAGDYAQARADYGQARQFPATFYGQLSLAKLEPAPALRLRDTAADTTTAEQSRYQSHDLTRAIRVLGDLGMVSLLRTFATYDAESHPEPKHLKLLAADLSSMGFTDVAVRVAKNAAYNGYSFLNYSHPVMTIPGYSGPGSTPEAAFVLAIIRQETEFDPAAVSGSGARGLMQLMPSSAEHNARRAGVDYRPADLLASPTYNMQLGMVEMADDLVYYGGSYLLTAAAYNAGKGNVNKWISAFGDPRSPVVNPVDWIEEIPFGETRNYVARVLENTQVYRNRLSGRDEPLRILSDLYRPRTPDVRPLPAAPVPTLRSDNGRAATSVANE